MNAQEFIEAIKISVVDNTIKSVESELIEPPGRGPAKKIIEMSGWYNKLDNENKSMVLRIIRESVEMSVFSFLCVLDGVMAIEDVGVKGKLNLYFEKEGVQKLLNGPDEEYLHNLFN